MEKKSRKKTKTKTERREDWVKTKEKITKRRREIGIKQWRWREALNQWSKRHSKGSKLPPLFWDPSKRDNDNTRLSMSQVRTRRVSRKCYLRSRINIVALEREDLENNHDIPNGNSFLPWKKTNIHPGILTQGATQENLPQDVQPRRRF